MRDRIRPPRRLERLLDELKDIGIFETKQKGMMFAAALGFARKRFEEPDQFGEGIRLEYFESKDDAAFISMIAIAHSDSLEVLEEARSDERLSIFENYAHTGLVALEEALAAKKSVSPLDVVLDLLAEVRKPEGSSRVEKLQGLF